MLCSEYRTITTDYPTAAAKAFAGLSPTFNFVHISGEGATREPGRFTPLFARTKGEAEAALLTLRSEHPSLRIYNVRPGFIDESGDKRKESGGTNKPLAYKILEPLAPVFRTFYPSGVSPTQPLAEMLVTLVERQDPAEDIKVSMQGRGVTWEGEGEQVGILIANVGVRRLAGLTSGC